MTKADLIELVHTRTGLSKAKAQEAIEAVFSELGEIMASGESYTHTGFGKFAVQTQKEHKGRNPRTGDEITIPEYRRVKFSTGKTLKERLNP